MKAEVEGSFIPVKVYDFTLPKDFKIEEPGHFVTTLPTKKSDKPHPQATLNKSISANSKAQISIQASENEDSESIFPQDQQPPKAIILKPKTQISMPRPASTQSITKPTRPYSAITKTLPKYLQNNAGKTIEEQDKEENQKTKAKEFVTDWLEKADKRREDSVKELELKTKIPFHFDNKLSDEINELLKKINYTRKHTTSSLKMMNKVMKTEPEAKFSKPEMKNNPFRTSIVTNDWKERKTMNNVPKTQGLNLRELYTAEKTSQGWVPVIEKNFEPQGLISDDEDFVKDISLDEDDNDI
ncbi:hypothetical protein SteCoe_1602 [Stentor coeruleus]|uniref:Uncharacterized protein n=1 Tax=Stentor coeruleus TaxID=5963 RepID=A0A1R2D1D6_9CILI|nr:hypothetical protein SteCoe_1602 [Stentor coeruleus]